MTRAIAMDEHRGELLRRSATSDASRGVALWRRVADELERAILLGHFQDEEKLPGEVAIAGRFEVNRHTVRRALAALAERGLVRAERGSGTYVRSSRLRYPIRPRTRFSEIVGAAGRAADASLIASAIERAGAETAKRLRLQVGAQLIRLELLRHADGVPICAATSWLSAQRFEGVAEIYSATRSMTKTLAHFGIHDYARQSTRVAAMMVDGADALRLDLAPGRPLLVVESVDADRRGRPLLTTRARFAADRIELTIET
jgi:GntR family phosphonate transport system transcriptional regulator